MADLKYSSCPHKSPYVGSIGNDLQLPKREVAFYLVALLSIIAYAGHGFYVTYGQDLATSFPPDLLKEGWLRQYKDVYENFILETAAMNWKLLILASLGYLVVSKATLVWSPMFCHHIACAVYTIVLSAIVVSPESAVLFLALYCIVICLSYYSYVAVCVLVASLLYSHKIASDMSLLSTHLRLHGAANYVFLAIFGYLLCRLMSLGCSLRCQLTQQQEKDAGTVPTFVQHIRANIPLTLHYAFYLPYFWSGPILTYDTFRERLEARERVASIDESTIRWVSWRACRMILWFLLLQLIYHYLPVGSYLLSIDSNAPAVYKHLAFAMFLQGQNFMLVHVQIFGWPAVLAKLDGVQLLDWPNCISWIYSYSIMWRVFDRGLFAVLRASIYLPLGGNRQGPVRQVLAIFASFAFICFFHGDTSNIYAWVALSMSQLIMENLVSTIYFSHIRGSLTKYISPLNEKRIISYVVSWNMMVPWCIIFFLLAGPNGSIVMPEIMHMRSSGRRVPVGHMLTIHFAAYCALQIGRFYESKSRSGACH